MPRFEPNNLIPYVLRGRAVEDLSEYRSSAPSANQLSFQVPRQKPIHAVQRGNGLRFNRFKGDVGGKVQKALARYSIPFAI